MLSCGASLFCQILLYPYPHHQTQEVLWLTSFIIIMHNIIFYASGGDLFHKISQVKVSEV